MESYLNNKIEAKQPINKWNRAAIDGLKLAAISVAFMLIAQMVKGGLSVVLTLLKLGATIGFLWWVMKKYSQDNAAIQGITPYGEVFKYGIITSFLSSIVLAVFLYINMVWINPDAIEAALDAYQSQMRSFNDEAAEAMLESIFNNIEIISCASAILMYTLWGIIISAILASSTKKDTPTPTINIES